MTEYATKLESGVDTAPRLRVADAVGLVPGADALSARGGIRAGGGAVTVSAGTMQVNVAPLIAWVDGGSSSDQGGYAYVLDASKSLTLSDGHATLDRVDTIAVVLHDDAFDGSSVTSASVVVVQGTPGGGAPTLPASSVPLRNVNVPHGASAGTGGLASGNLGADRRPGLAALGGLLPVASGTERDALTPYDGMAVYRTDANMVQVYNGATWDDFPAHNDTGWQQVSGVGGGLGTNVNSAARKIGNQVSLHLELDSLTYSNAGTGNIADVTVLTLASQWRPSKAWHGWFATTKAGGSVQIKANGDVLLRTLYGPGIDTDDSVFISATYLTD